MLLRKYLPKLGVKAKNHGTPKTPSPPQAQEPEIVPPIQELNLDFKDPPWVRLNSPLWGQAMTHVASQPSPPPRALSLGHGPRFARYRGLAS